MQAFARYARVLCFAQGVLCWRIVLYVVRRAPAAPLALLAVPGGEGLRAPTPRTPTRGKLSLQAFARLRARAALRAGCFVLAHVATRRVCWRTQPPAVCDKSCSPLSPVVKCARQAILDLS